MTEQPQPGQVPGQVEEEAQVGGEVQPTTEALGAEWRFFVRLQDNPDAPNYLQPQSLHRMQETETDFHTHRFDRKTRSWVHNPGMIAFTGGGGSDDFQEIDEDNANALIAQWSHFTDQGKGEMGEAPDDEFGQAETEEEEEEEAAT